MYNLIGYHHHHHLPFKPLDIKYRNRNMYDELRMQTMAVNLEKK